MSKFHRNKKKAPKGSEQNTIWLLIIAAAVLVIILATL